MSSKREQILARFETLLANTSGVNGRIYRSRQQALNRDEAPALVIEPGRDTPSVVSTCKLDWSFDVLVAIYVQGVVPDQDADPVAVSMHNELMSDRTLGGLAVDLVPSGVDFKLDDADMSTLWMINTYTVRYRTSISSLES
jgi:hypothetical protein